MSASKGVPKTPCRDCHYRFTFEIAVGTTLGLWRIKFRNGRNNLSRLAGSSATSRSSRHVVHSHDSHLSGSITYTTKYTNQSARVRTKGGSARFSRDSLSVEIEFRQSCTSQRWSRNASLDQTRRLLPSGTRSGRRRRGRCPFLRGLRVARTARNLRRVPDGLREVVHNLIMPCRTGQPLSRSVTREAEGQTHRNHASLCARPSRTAPSSLAGSIQLRP